ncbi:hypothetical protein R84981_002753 [Carnimonas sp. R-84981]|uniref:DUF1833 family protein n=1 Tax=Carnimonas bestiolae TaxID=3402172 RepID=UPI003EDBB36D
MDSELMRWRSQGGEAYLISTLEIRSDSQEPLFLCAGFDEVTAKDGDQSFTFQPSPLKVAIPETSNTGNQTMTFGLQNVTTEAMQFADAAVEAGDEIEVIYREWLSNNLDAVASRPIRMIAQQFEVEGAQATIKCGHFDIINTNVWRKYYRGKQYPGARYQ